MRSCPSCWQLYASSRRDCRVLIDSVHMYQLHLCVYVQDIEKSIVKAGVRSQSQLESFLLKCLELQPQRRATAAELKATGDRFRV
jgi:hypothetical protein